jgi:hypothetical protein
VTVFSPASTWSAPGTLWRVTGLLLRRWWVLGLCAVVAALAALAITALRPAPYVASAFVAVPVAAAPDVGDRTAQALALAQVLGMDRSLAARVDGKLAVFGEENTTQIELYVQADSAEAALAGAREAARHVVEDGTPAAPAGSLVVLSLPDGATLDGTGRAEVLAVAALLGLVAAAIGVGWRHRADTSVPESGK